ncbi:bactofilin family protein [Oceanobacter mangrovi]|uniref:bactofilin family protein n=1 Tax=Oceanobacter mangrovi TaxID=2862510 RepID=UPI001C8E4C3D|nr:polymer-forming cytoskeletal protein [Oceanobacter mangrovi]
MFSAKDKSSNVQYDTLISAKTEITGDVRFSGGLHVDGVIKGNLLAEAGGSAVLRISNKGRVEGEIKAPNIIINGEVSGDVHAFEYIELAKDARVTGDVYYKAMEMVLGACVNGQLKHVDAADKTAKLKPVQSVPEAKVD